MNNGVPGGGRLLALMALVPPGMTNIELVGVEVREKTAGGLIMGAALPKRLRVLPMGDDHVFAAFCQLVQRGRVGYQAVDETGQPKVDEDGTPVIEPIDLARLMLRQG